VICCWVIGQHGRRCNVDLISKLSTLRPLVPDSLRRLRHQQRWASIRKQYARLSVADAFAETYRNRLWGEAEGEEFCSGGGSSERFSAPYVEYVARLIADNGVSAVVDLGCGDFRVGRRICKQQLVRYTGVDVVPDLIAYNRSRFGSDRIDFVSANIIEDELPDGQLCMIRQVLQHLSNDQISRVITKCRKYPYLLITEDVYAGSGMRPNLDHTHGPDNRLCKRSGVYVDLPPYNLRAEAVLEMAIPETHSLLRTSLIEQPAVRG
jgi:SAM-dependent methyltransferase